VAHKYNGTILHPDADDINYMHWNVNHLTNKLEDVEIYVASYPGLLHIVTISETWLTPDNYKTYQLPSYTAFHNVRSSDSGGISIFIHDSLCDIMPEVLFNVTSTDLHHFIVIRVESIKTTIAVPYNRPKGKKSSFLNDLQRLCLGHRHCLLIGDFNMNQLDSNKHDELSDILESHGFGLLNALVKDAATRLKSGTIIDLVATNMLSHRYKVSIVHNSQSDHGILYVSMERKFRLPPAKRKVKTKFDSNAAIDMVTTLCGSANDDMDGNELNKALETIVERCTSTISIKSDHRINKRHVSRELIMAVRERGRLYTLMNLHPENAFIEREYHKMVAFIKLRNYELRSGYECERIEASAGDNRKTWKLYKEIVFNQYKTNRECPVTIDGQTMSESVKSCNVVNDHFFTAGEHLATEIIAIHGYGHDDIDNLYPQHAGNNWSFKEVQPETIIEAIKSLPNKKATGIDKVTIGLLKSTSVVIAPLIALCINIMIRTMVFPAELLKGRLKLIHKNGTFDIENFRGLTLLPALSKIFEYVLTEQLLEYLNGLNFFKGNQFGFIRQSSCISAAYQLVNFLKSTFRKKYVALIFIDLKRAFDTVDPKRLSLKFGRVGLAESAVELLMSYLCNRTTATVIGNYCSGFRSISIGVAQGSKMGPLHFLIYIADLLTLGLLGKILLYADDTALYYAADTPEELEDAMQRDAIMLHDWLCQNVLTMNVGKTCYMTFGKAKNLPDFNIKINDEKIKRVKTFKYLGLVLDENLSFKQHIDHVMKSIRPFIPLMWKRGRYLPMEKRKQLYFAYVQSHIAYMLPIYSVGTKTRLDRLQRVQNRCIKALYQLPHLTPTTYLYSSSILPVGGQTCDS